MSYRRNRNRRRSFDPGRLFAGFLMSAGAIALGLSFYNPISRASEPTPTFFVEELPEVTGTSQSSQLKAAPVAQFAALPSSPSQPNGAAEDPDVAPTPTKPLIREAVPLEALPASKVKSVSGSTGRSSSSGAGNADGPLIVAIASASDAGSEDIASRIAAGLRAAGRQVALTSVEEAGRPDVLLVLDTAGSGTTQAWYCDPGPLGNARLAELLIADVPRGEDAEPSASPDAAFACDEVHSGRAQTAAVLLDLAADVAADEATVAGVSKAINRYLSDNSAAIRQARAGNSFIWPAGGPISSHFGPSHPLGIDVAQGNGNIVAAVDGKVVFAGGNPCCSYGYYVVIESAGGIHTLYAHLDKIDVKLGQTVRQGQALGPVGCTGYCFGIHLHFEVFQDGVRIDPMRYLP